MKKALIIVCSILGAAIIAMLVLYFIQRNLLFMKLSLVFAGLINLLNGIFCLKRGIKTAGIILLIGGGLLTLYMLILCFI